MQLFTTSLWWRKLEKGNQVGNLDIDKRISLKEKDVNK
jgi:hypothetical protein